MPKFETPSQETGKEQEADVEIEKASPTPKEAWQTAKSEVYETKKVTPKDHAAAIKRISRFERIKSALRGIAEAGVGGGAMLLASHAAFEGAWGTLSTPGAENLTALFAAGAIGAVAWAGKRWAKREEEISAVQAKAEKAMRGY